MPDTPRQPMTTLEQIRAEIRVGFGVQDTIDGLVHEQASQMATATNNDGLSSQLSFLNARGLSDEDVLTFIRTCNA